MLLPKLIGRKDGMACVFLPNDLGIGPTISDSVSAHHCANQDCFTENHSPVAMRSKK